MVCKPPERLARNASRLRAAAAGYFLGAGVRATQSIAASSKRRVCHVEGCGTVLSRYNNGDRCSLHSRTDLERSALDWL